MTIEARPQITADPWQSAHRLGGSGLHSPRAFKSFWMGGFESACHINTRGVRIDMLQATQHDLWAEQDYHMLREIGIRTVRDGLRWPCIEQTPGQYDWSTFLPMVRAARNTGTQVIWNLLHYGWPLDVDILSGAFVDRFARFCTAAARIIRDEAPNDPPLYVPVNEISFLAWGMGTSGYVQPLHLGKDAELKRQLIRAAIAGMEAIWSVDRRARFAHVDPLIHIVAPIDRPDLEPHAAAQRAAQFEAWDMLAGKCAPELGGHPKYLDLVGVNYYHSNQFECPDNRLRWEDEPRDPRWLPFHRLLQEIHERYHRPLFIAETSHFGCGRARWIREIATEIYRARLARTPVEGVCLYPIIDRPDWEDMNVWHNSGLWDLRRNDGRLHRELNREYFQAFREARRLLHTAGCC